MSGRGLDLIKTTLLIRHRTGIGDLQRSARSRSIGDEQRIPNPKRQVTAPLNPVRAQSNAGESQVHIQTTALKIALAGRGDGLFDSLQKRVWHVGRMVLRQLPDHHPTQAMVAGIADLGLTGALIIIG